MTTVTNLSEPEEVRNHTSSQENVKKLPFPYNNPGKCSVHRLCLVNSRTHVSSCCVCLPSQLRHDDTFATIKYFVGTHSITITSVNCPVQNEVASSQLPVPAPLYCSRARGCTSQDRNSSSALKGLTSGAEAEVMYGTSNVFHLTLSTTYGELHLQE